MRYGHDLVRTKILIEGLGGRVQLLTVHWHAQDANRHIQDITGKAPLPRIRATTVQIVRSLVDEGLFELGTLAPNAHTVTPVTDLEAALADLYTDYVDHFEVFGWQYHWWLTLTPKGRQLAQPLINTHYHQQKTPPPSSATRLAAQPFEGLHVTGHYGGFHRQAGSRSTPATGAGDRGRAAPQAPLRSPSAGWRAPAGPSTNGSA